MNSGITRSLICLLLGLAATGCGESGQEAKGVTQTGFPGQVSAGGATSGTVMAQSTAGKTGSSMPAGTPGIPKGAEGNVGGTESGSSAHAQQANQTGGAQPAASATPGAPPVREGRGSTAPDAGSASSSVPRGNVADTPAPREQAGKEKSQ
jgi:hypothetical protein